MTQRIRLSHKAIDALESPKSGRTHVYDEAVPGLAVCITSAGRKIFYWIGRTPAGPSRIQIGPYPKLPLDAARIEAKKISADAASGIAPRPARQIRKSAWTLLKVFTHYMTNYSKPHKKTWERDQKQFDRTLAEWKHHPLSAITKAMVIEKHVALGESAGPYGGNKMLELLRSLFNYATDELDLAVKNPTRGVRRFKTTERERFLGADELGQFFRAVAQLQREVSRDFFMLCLFTGARRGNVCAMRWSDVNMNRSEWRIPGEESKSGEPMLIVLSDPAMEILRRRQKAAIGDWVLPGQGQSGHFAYPKAAWERILKLSGITNLRIHDLRRTLGSWQAMSGASLLMIAKSLGHTSLSSTKVYARLQNDPVRESVDAAINAMVSAAHQNDDSLKNLATCPSGDSQQPSGNSRKQARRRKRPKR